jgi:hypothetical protein
VKEKKEIDFYTKKHVQMANSHQSPQSQTNTHHCHHSDPPHFSLLSTFKWERENLTSLKNTIYSILDFKNLSNFVRDTSTTYTIYD